MIPPHILKKDIILLTVIISILFSVGSTNHASAQHMLSREISWNPRAEKITTPDGETISFMTCRNCVTASSRDYLPLYSVYLQNPGGAITSAVFTSMTFEPAALTPLQLRNIHARLDTTIHIRIQNGTARLKPVSSISFIPLRINPETGEIEKLTQFSLRIVPEPAHAKRQQQYSYASNSVLASGQWYKIPVTSAGVYKIDYNYLKTLGMNPDAIDPRHIRLFGNGGGMLPEENSVPRIDDLAENAIYISGEGDGRFDPGDYILFYTKGVNTWKLNAQQQRFEHQIHLYSDEYYYFLTVDPQQTGKRITTPATPANPNTQVYEYDAFQVYEKDLYNFIQSGREWYGDYFTIAASTQSYNFNFPGRVDNLPVKLRIGFAGRSTTSGSSLEVRVNNQSIGIYDFQQVGTSYTSNFARILNMEEQVTTQGENIVLRLTFTSPSSSAEGWLNYIEINARCRLKYNGGQMAFRDLNSVGAGNVSTFHIDNAHNAVHVWDVTDPVNPLEMPVTLSGQTLTFTAPTDSLREFIAFDINGNYLIPGNGFAIDNQNLHGTVGQPDMVIVTHPDFSAAAGRLAGHHRQSKGLDVAVVNVFDIYNEFSSGTPDITAIRDFMRMLYKRAGNDTTLLPRYLLLFGDGSYDPKDRVANNNNFIPTYQSPNSHSPTLSFTSDDYFGFYDDNEGGSIIDNNDYLDVAIGRLPVNTPAEAEAVVDKIIHYESNETFGSWRNTLTFVADDEDNNIHFNQSESLNNYIANNFPQYNIDKIYLDAYPQESTPGGSRYPAVNEAINARIFNGTAIINYTGHGGEEGWGHERILTIPEILSWENYDKLPVFITATCSFSRYDNPAKKSGGELALTHPDGGAIALVTTVRLVYAGENFTLNDAFLKQMFTSNGGKAPSLGEVMMRTKNAILNGNDDANNRKFTLLGDPAMHYVYPRYEVVTTAINGKPINSGNIDTLKALSYITIKGEVRDKHGQKLQGYNGFVYPTIFDKPVTITTLKNDPSSQQANFTVQKNIIYKGKASVINGEFEFSFIVPKDIAYNFGAGKISYYAHDAYTDASGYTSDIIIGGTGGDVNADNTGPDIQLFMNDENFISGGITTPDPVLLVLLSDESGINTTGSGIGHDITAVLDDDDKNTIVLNAFYEADLDSYQSGSIRYPLKNLAPGKHHIRVKAWDIYNNSSEASITFTVVNEKGLVIENAGNYPNPVTDYTIFHFEHNQPDDVLRIKIHIYDVMGRRVKTINNEFVSAGYRMDGIRWDGTDDYRAPLGKGVYLYNIEVDGQQSGTAKAFGKLIILK